MSTIVMPSWATRQPGQGAAARKSGLGLGLAAVAYPVGALQMYEAVSGKLMTPTATPTHLTGPAGGYSVFNGTTQYHTLTIPPNRGEGYTLFSLAYPADTSSKGDTVSLAQAGQIRCMAIQANYQGTNDWGAYIFDGSQAQLSYQGTIVDVANRTDAVVLRLSTQGSDLWVNGVAAGSSGAAVAYGANAPTSLQVGTINVSGSQDYFLKGGVALAGVAYRLWSQDEIAAFTANPWQIFAGAPRRIWVALGGLNTYVLNAGVGTYALTGAAAQLLRTRLLGATAGAYTLTGDAARLARGYMLLATGGSYLLSGVADKMLWTRVLAAAAGAYALSGNAALLARGYALLGSPGSYTLTGAAVSYKRTYVIGAAAGGYTLAGQSANMARGYLLAATAGSYGVTGKATSFPRTYVLGAARGSYAVGGRDALLAYSGVTIVFSDYLIGARRRGRR